MFIKDLIDRKRLDSYLERTRAYNEQWAENEFIRKEEKARLEKEQLRQEEEQKDREYTAERAKWHAALRSALLNETSEDVCLQPDALRKELSDLSSALRGNYNTVRELIGQMNRNMEYIRLGKLSEDDFRIMLGQLDNLTDAFYYWSETLREQREQTDSFMKSLPASLPEDIRHQADELYEEVVRESRILIPKLKDTFEEYKSMVRGLY